MSSNKSPEKEESSQESFINIPPLSGTEEEVMEAERISIPGFKDKGLQQSELFETQKLMSGFKTPSYQSEATRSTAWVLYQQLFREES